MTWTTPGSDTAHRDAACCFCGARTPSDVNQLRSTGWQVRNDYPVRFRCPACRRRQDGTAAA